MPTRRRTAPARLAALLLLLLCTPLSIAAQAEERLPSPSAALTWSLVGTLAPVAVGAAQMGGGNADGLLVMDLGVTVGPALGYFYSGQGGRGWVALGVRFGVLFGSLAGGFAICGWDCSPRSDEAATATMVMVAGGAIAVASAAWDITRLRGSVKRRNARWAEATVSVVPLMHPMAGGGGVAVSIRF